MTGFLPGYTLFGSALLGCLLTVTSAWAAPAARQPPQVLQPKKITLAEIAKIAIENSELLKSQLMEVQADVLLAQGAGLLPNPMLMLQGGSLSSDSPPGALVEIGFLQTFPFPGKLSSLRKLSSTQKTWAELHGLDLTRRVQHEVTLLAVRLVVLRELAKHSTERRSRFHLIRKYLRTHPRVSPSQEAEAVLIENQLRLLEKGILELEEQRKMVEVGLQFFLKSSEPLDPEFAWITAPTPPRLEDLERILSQEGIDAQKKDLEVKQAEIMLTKEKLTPFPDITLGASYRSEASSPTTYFYTGFLNVTFPLFDRGQYGIPAAHARLESQRLQQEYLRRQLKRQLQEYYYKVETSSRLLHSFPTSLFKISEKQFTTAEKAFRKDRLSATQLLQLDAQVHETLDAIFSSQLNYLENLSHLLLFVGRPLEWK